MSRSYDTELLADAAGVKIVKTSIPSTNKIILQFDDTNELSTRNDKSSCGFHLTKSKWDPYPWVGSVEHESIADRAGLRYILKGRGGWGERSTITHIIFI